MKIICESQEEYDKLNRTFRYLHDFRIEDKKGNMISLDQEYEMVGTLCHMHLEGRDFPEKTEFMCIQKKNVHDSIMNTLSSATDQIFKKT